MHLIQKYKTLVLLFLLIACTNGQNIDGDWSVLSSEGDYSELLFGNEKMRIYSDIGGYIGFRNTSTKQDSLLTNSLNYKMNWVNKDSLILSSHLSTLYLARIKSGFKLSDFTNESLEQKFIDNFYDRMYLRKGINPDSIYSSAPNYPEVKEEIIEIKRK